ncbi:MAG: hypothetical protein AAB676_17970 [Verrucomicrobiota bacterium]
MKIMVGIDLHSNNALRGLFAVRFRSSLACASSLDTAGRLAPPRLLLSACDAQAGRAKSPPRSVRG